MKKLLLLPLLLASFVATAATRPVTPDQSRSSIVDISQRVLIFQQSDNSISADGVILVCRLPSISIENGRCLNNGVNAWTEATNISIPGYVLTSFEHRWVGAGFRQLILYFEKR